jgi:glyoxylase-like metal-dependent hydrolase (beta-lactamase superfamily II)
MKKWIKSHGLIIYQVLSGRSNSFLVSSNDKFFLIDTGRASSWKKLSKNLDDILGENQLSCLILTHTHFDHCENATKIKEKYNCKVIVHECEANYLKNGESPLPKGTNILTRFLINFIGKRIQSRYKYDPVHLDIAIDEKFDLNKFGFQAYIIPTPGHSPGSISIIIDDGLAIVGDAMFGVFKWSIFPPFADNTQIMIESWGKLLKTGCSTYLPGHGSEISLNLLEKEYKNYNNDSIKKE